MLFNMVSSTIYEPFPYLVLMCSILNGILLINNPIALFIDIIIIFYALIIIAMRKSNRRI